MRKTVLPAITAFVFAFISYIASAGAVCPAPVALSLGDSNPALGVRFVGDDDITQAMMQLKFSNLEEEVGISSVTVAGGGSGDEATEIREVRLYHDVNSDGQLDDFDTLLGTGTFDGDNGSVELAASPTSALMTGGGSGAEKNALIVYVIKNSAVSDKTYQVALIDETDVTAQDGACGLANFSGAPLIGGQLTISYGSVSAATSLMNPTSGFVFDGQDNVPMIQLAVAGGSNEDLEIDSVTITDVTAAQYPTYITAVRLWLDADGSGTVTVGDAQLNADQTFTEGFTNLTLVAEGGTTIPQDTTRYLLVTYSFADGAPQASMGGLGSIARALARAIISAPFALAGCGGSETAKALDDAPEGFVFTDAAGNVITSAEPGDVVQIRTESGLPIMQFVMGTVSLSLDGAKFARDEFGTYISLSGGSVSMSLKGISDKVSGIPQDITAFVPCAESDNSVAVCRGETAVPDRLSECVELELLRNNSPNSDDYLWQNPGIGGAADCLVAGLKTAFNSFYGAGVFSARYQAAVDEPEDIVLTGITSLRTISAPSLSAAGGQKMLIYDGN